MKTRRPSLYFRTIQLVTLFVGCAIMTWAPVASASIGQDELEDFVKWPLYQECDESSFTDITTPLGITITGSSPFLNGDPLSLHYPTITDEIKFAEAMSAFVRKYAPGSPWNGVTDLGKRLVDEGKLRDVNPMLVVVIGRKETGFASDGGASSRNLNSFGNKGNGPRGYRTWPSIDASLFGDDSFTKAVQDRLEGKHPNYVNVKNMYEYLSVHVSGQIIYPGDAKTVHDELMNVNIDAAHVKEYFEQARGWIAEMTGLTITGIPARSTSASTTTEDQAAQESCQGENANSGAAGSGVVNADGYAFPLEPQTKRPYGTLPCAKRTCHHDGTPAFDLAYGSAATMGGKKEYAISDGTIIKRGIYRGVEGCYSIQFKSSKDNMYYWYGHMQNPNMQLEIGKKNAVKAGDVLGEVGRVGLGPVCHGRSPTAEPAPHLHIDRGCIKNGQPQEAGSDDCRDWAFVPFMNDMWEKLKSE